MRHVLAQFDARLRAVERRQARPQVRQAGARRRVLAQADTGVGDSDDHGAGGSVAADYALSHPERLLSLTVSSNNLAAANGYIAEAAKQMHLKEWDDLPRWFRELGPSYRAANPAGVAKWTELNEISESGKGARQKLLNVVTPEKLETLKVRTLLMTGAADMFTPPSIMRMIARHVPDNQVVIVPECGHSPYWEQPEFFNRTVLDFIGQHG